MDLVFLFENKASLLLLENINKIICIHIGFFWDFLYLSYSIGRTGESTGAGYLLFEIWNTENKCHWGNTKI